MTDEPQTSATESVADVPEPEQLPPPPVVIRWLGDESVFVSGMPNRDIREGEVIEPEALELALAIPTHEKVE